jgi:secreted trypsin-like serine protease
MGVSRVADRHRVGRTGLLGVAIAAALLGGAVPAAAGPATKPGVPAVSPPLPVSGKELVAGAEPAPAPLRLAQKRTKPTQPTQSRLGSPTPLTVGGADASPGEYPYFVSIRHRGTGIHFCGGALVSTTQVVTSGLCVAFENPQDLTVAIGGRSLFGSEAGLTRQVTAITVAPGFEIFPFRNDVALLTLDVPITNADRTVQWVRPAVGNEHGQIEPGDDAVAIGHGAETANGPLHSVLQEVSLPIQADGAMVTRYGDAFVPDQMIGAGPLEGGRGVCTGDLGTPLVIPLASPPDRLVGVDSFGGACGAPNGPPVFTQLNEGPLADFVNSHVVRPSNDQFANAQTLPGNAGSAFGSSVNATVESFEDPFSAITVWYSWTPTQSGPARVAVNQHQFDSRLAVFTGSSTDTLTRLVENDDANDTLQSQVDFNAVAGTTYHLQVDGFGFDYGSFTVSYGVNRPANDDFLAAAALPGTTGQVVTTNQLATGEAGETATFVGNASSSVWYTFTAPDNTTARFSTVGSDFDTTLAVFTGSRVGATSTIRGNDDFNATLQSFITLPMVAGITYRVAVSGYNGQRGTIRLQYAFGSPSSDAFATPTPLFNENGAAFGSNARTTGEPGEPTVITPPDGSIWYRWTAPATGFYRLTTAGSNFDTILAVFTGDMITTMNLVAVNDDFNGTLQSRVDFSAFAGQTFRFMIEGYGAARGDTQLNYTRAG